ncbi:alpha/beta hydrolase fold domain-containing protein [Pseudomonas citronellolis]|uniref:alpha/beta hydrolase fold domain-containing protein n=1 Tax=Pseudomonas citronellolis TaxID=53408 RepID=UPI0036F320D6
MSARLDCLVISLCYHLAPETPFPRFLDDNYAALRWLHLTHTDWGRPCAHRNDGRQLGG